MIEPSIEIKMNWFAFTGIATTSIYGFVYMVINSIDAMKEIIAVF